MTTAKVRRPAVWAAAVYGAGFFALGAVFPFLPLIAATRGLSSVQVGLVLAIGPLANTLVPPFFGRLADKYRARGTLLVISSLACAAAVWVLVLWPSHIGTVAAVALLWSCRAPIVPLADASARAVLGARGHAFGHIRAWGSLGFAIAVFTSGALEIRHNLSLAVGISSVAYLFAAAAAWALGNDASSADNPATVPEIAPTPEAYDAVPENTALATPAATGDGKLPFLLLLATGLYGGMHAISDGFFPVYITDLGHSERLVGIAWGSGVALEIVVMFLSPALLKRFDALRLLQFAVACGALRWTGVALARDALSLTALQLIHAVSFGLWYVAVVEAVQRITSAKRRATAQGTSTAAVGMGQLVGFVLAGELYSLGSGPLAFSVAACGALVAAFLYGRLARQRAAGPTTLARTAPATPSNRLRD